MTDSPSSFTTQITRFGLVNAYLVREDDGFTLVDTTLPRGAGRLMGAARQAGGEIRRIALKASGQLAEASDDP